MRISDWSSDVCSSDLCAIPAVGGGRSHPVAHRAGDSGRSARRLRPAAGKVHLARDAGPPRLDRCGIYRRADEISAQRLAVPARRPGRVRSEEHTSELQSLMRTSYAVFCLKKKKDRSTHNKLYTM